MPVGIILHTSSPTQTHNDLGSLTIGHQPTLPSYLLNSKLFIEKKKIRDLQLTSGRDECLHNTKTHIVDLNLSHSKLGKQGILLLSFYCSVIFDEEMIPFSKDIVVLFVRF